MMASTILILLFYVDPTVTTTVLCSCYSSFCQPACLGGLALLIAFTWKFPAVLGEISGTQ